MFRQTRRRRPRFASWRDVPAAARPPADHIERAFPAPGDSPFGEILEVLDRAFVGPGDTERQDAKPGRPRRVLPLAILAVLAVVLFALTAIEITWTLAGERYADEVVGERF